MMERVNPALIDLARWSISNREKVGFVPPPGVDPTGGGMPPGGPGGAPPPGMPPGGPPPMPPPGGDPMAGGGAPPPPPPGGDPSGGAPPPPPPPDPTSLAPPPPPPLTADNVKQIVDQALSAHTAANGAGAKGKGKANPLEQDTHVIKTLLVNLYQHLNLPVPADTLLSPDQGQAGGSAPAAGGSPDHSKAAEAPGINIGTPAQALSSHDVGVQASALALVRRRMQARNSGG